MSVDQAYNFREIHARLSTAGILGEDQLLSLGAEGYEAVINLLPDENEYAQRGERGIVERQQIIYRYIPVDFSAPTRENYRAFCVAMQELKDKKTLVHCAANYRASAFYALYACHQLDWSDERAMEFIQSIWHPAEYPQWAVFIRKMMQENNLI